MREAAPHPALAVLGPPSPRSASLRRARVSRRGARAPLLRRIPVSHVRVAPFIVNNRPETMDRGRRSFPATIGLCSPRTSGPARRLERDTLVSRAQRSTKWCAADPGSLRSVAVPDQRCTASLRRALHRIRDTQASDARVPYSLFKQPFSFSRRAGVRGLRLLLRSPRIEGGRSAERRLGARRSTR